MIPIPKVTTDLRSWAEQTAVYLKSLEKAVEQPSPKAIQLEHATSSASAAIDGLLMWDSVNGNPVVSKGGEWWEVKISPMLMPFGGITDKARS